jgi:hypothetical protein
MRNDEILKLEYMLDNGFDKQTIIESLKPRQTNHQDAPAGGISLRAAERKYKVSNRTISNWVKAGYIPVLLRTKKQLYVDEAKLAEIANYHIRHGGRGKWSILKKMRANAVA